MSRISPFLTYSTHENGATNNTLLLMRMIYETGLGRFIKFLQCLFDDADLDGLIGVQFEQQTRQSESVPDGAIFQAGFRFIFETKLTDAYDLNQLLNHANGLKNIKGRKLLIWLGPRLPDPKLMHNALEGIRSLECGASFHAITFTKVLESAKECALTHDEELLTRISEYEEYCQTKELLDLGSVRLRAVGCRETFNINAEFKLYFDPCRSFSKHNYIGAYGNKSIRYIGKIDKIIRCDVTEDSVLNVTDEYDQTCTLSNDEKDRVFGAVTKSRAQIGYAMDVRHQFFLCSEWIETDFKKASKGALWGVKYFDLAAQITPIVAKTGSLTEIASQLSKLTWE